MNKKNEFSSLLANLNLAKVQDEQNIQTRITIREEFKNLIPPLTLEELQQLEANILNEGVRDPILLWEDGDELVLIDGHNRFAIATKHALQFHHKILSFASAEEVKKWMVTNQLGRRNLSPEQQSYLRGLRYLQEKSQGQRTDLTSGQNVKKSEGETTAAKLGAEFNVSERTIVRDAEFAKGIDKLEQEEPGLRAEILSGKSTLTKHDIQEVGKNKISPTQVLHVEKKQRVADPAPRRKPSPKNLHKQVDNDSTLRSTENLEHTPNPTPETANPSGVGESEQPNPPETKTIPLDPFTPERVAEIAFSFFTSNYGTIDEIAEHIHLTKPFRPLDFLIKWSQHQPPNP